MDTNSDFIGCGCLRTNHVMQHMASIPQRMGAFNASNSICMWRPHLPSSCRTAMADSRLAFLDACSIHLDCMSVHTNNKHTHKHKPNQQIKITTQTPRPWFVSPLMKPPKVGVFPWVCSIVHTCTKHIPQEMG